MRAVKCFGMALCVLLTASASATTYYVSYGGAGAKTGVDWANAFDSIQSAVNAMSLGTETGAAVDHTVKVALTTGAQSYSPAGYSGSIQNPTTIRYAGGYDPNTDTQTGTSALKGSGVTGTDYGLYLYKSSGDHGEYAKMTVDRFDISDVSVGARISGNAGYDKLRPTIGLSNSTVTSGTHGLQVDYNKNYVSQGPSGFTVTDSTITAGQDPARAGDALKLRGPRPEVTVTDSSLTSGTGGGIYVQHVSGSGGVNSGNQFFVKVTNSEIVDTAADGIHYEDTKAISYYSRVVEIELDKAKITGNAGDGVDVLTWSESDWTGGNNTGEIHFSATNSVVADNDGNGVYLVGKSVNRTDTAQVEVSVLNSTIADNELDGLHTETDHNTGGPHTVRNSIIALNGGDGIDVDDGDGSGMVVIESYNDFFGNIGTDLLVHGASVALDGTDLAVDPTFAGFPPDLYRPMVGNVVLDAASAVYAPTDDIVGDPRPMGAGDAMGAYEAGASLPVPEPASLGLVGLALLALGRRRS